MTIDLYTWGTPNGRKVSVMLEECGLPYTVHKIDITKNDQFKPEFIAINPNSKIPAIVDPDGPKGKKLALFESGAILIYLADKTGKLMPKDGESRYRVIEWLMWQMGSAPFLGGGFGHFYAYAPSKIEYAIDRYAMEVKRQLDVLNRRLAQTRFLAGDEYTLADIAVWPWYGALAKGLLYNSGEFLQVDEYTHVRRWTDEIALRPAVKRGRMVNRLTGQPASQLHERHDASDFGSRTEDKLAAPS